MPRIDRIFWPSLTSLGDPPFFSSHFVKSISLTSCSTRASATDAFTTLIPMGLSSLVGLTTLRADWRNSFQTRDTSIGLRRSSCFAGNSQSLLQHSCDATGFVLVSVIAKCMPQFVCDGEIEEITRAHLPHIQQVH